MVDRYTKAVLTVIAVALLALAAENAIRPAAAQSDQIQKVQICDTQNCASLSPVETQLFGRIMSSWGLRVVPAHVP